jgi:LPXTG-site transpeptidase (sortase) family protein
MDSRVARRAPSDTRTRLVVVLLALAAVLAATGLALSRDDTAGGGTTPPPAAVAGPMETESPTILERAPRGPRERDPGPAEGPPSQLVVPTLGVRAPVVPIEMDAAGVLTPPADVDSVGWWQRSAEPGAGSGQTLITGHTVRVGDGALDRIGELARGSRVEVRAAAGTASYRVTDVVTYDRAQVAAQAHELFGQDRTDGRLVLVTCTDWNGEVWERNIIVLAQPV